MTSSSEHHLKLRHLRLEDYQPVCQLVERVYVETPDKWSRRHYERLLSLFGEGQLCIENNGVVVAVALTVQVDYTRHSDPDRYEDLLFNQPDAKQEAQGDALYILDLFVDPEFRDIRLGQRLLEACKDLCGDSNLKAVLVGCILWDYEKHQENLSASQYIDQVESKQIHDEVLSFFLNNSFDLKRLLRRPRRKDRLERLGALLEWDNIFYESRGEGLVGVPKTSVRVGVVQWQMRKVDTLEAMMKQVEFFIQSMSSYKSDFALFPEFFTAPLMGLTTQNQSIEGIQRLAQYSPKILEEMSGLAVAYNINIIAGSLPVLGENGELYNVAYLCRRDGTIDSQYKIHPTPSEKFEWAMTGGNRLRVFDTDCGKIGILICYDVEFPELARLLCLEGMRILFVPFWTDTKNGFLRVQRCAQARAIENECYVAVAGSCGNLPEVNSVDIQYAQSAVYSPSDFAFPHDAIVSETTPNTEMELLVDLDMEKLTRLRNEGAVTNYKDRRKDLYELIWKGQK